MTPKTAPSNSTRIFLAIHPASSVAEKCQEAKPDPVSLLVSRMAVPVLYYMVNARKG